MKALHVWWDEEHVGELTTQDDVLRFRYAASASRRISRSLPITTEWQAGRFFANLLPDGALREALARRFGVSADNDFALLEKVGGDCAGALTLLPAGEEPRSLPQGKEALPLSRIEELAASEAGLVQALAQGRARLSLAGAQGKIPVILDG